jgi:hemerythrin-like domain-containing protein
MKVTETLSQEHRVIEQVLRCLHEMAARAKTTGSVPVASAESALKFFRKFADQCHHKKEEEVLFPALERAGFAAGAGPVAVMLEEHELGRKYLARIDAALQPARAGGPAAAEAFVGAVRAYVELLTQHIGKEDHILFPLADHAIGGRDVDVVLAGFSSSEAALDHGRLHAEMLAIADALGKEFGIARAAQASVFAGCCHGPAAH